jgi:hypothetical protein
MPGPGNRLEKQEALSQTQGFGMAPVYQDRRDGSRTLTGYRFDAETAARQGIVPTPKPAAILAEQERLGGKEIEPVYAQGTISRGRGGSETVPYGPPIGYRYDNGQSQYVNFDASGQYQGTADRQNLGTLIKDLAPLALAALGANYLVPMLSGAGAGGAGLLADTAALGLGNVAAATPLAFTPEMIAAGAFTPGSIGAYGASQGLLNAAQLAATYGTGGSLLSDLALAPTATPGTPPPPNLELPPPLETPIPVEPTIPSGPPSTPGTPPPPNVGPPGSNIPFELPSWATVPNALLAASAVSSIAKANETAPTAPTFTMAPYVPPSGKPFANLGMSPIATPYTPTRIAGQYDPTMTPGGVSPYELIMQQMQAPKNLYADFEAGTNIGGYDPRKFVTPQNAASAAVALSNNMGGLPNANLGAALPGEINPAALGAAFGTALPNGIELMNAINSGKISKGKLSGLLQA